MANLLTAEEPRGNLLSDDPQAGLLGKEPLRGSLLEPETDEKKKKRLEGKEARKERRRKRDVKRLMSRQEATSNIRGLESPITEKSKGVSDAETNISQIRRRTFKDPEEFDLTQVKDENPISPTSVVDFVFGDEMAILGVDLDNKNAIWSYENMKDQWSETPLWLNLLATGSLLGTLMFPAAKAAHVSLKFGKLGAALPGLRRGAWNPLLSKVDELEKFKKLKSLPTDPKDPGFIKNADDLSDSTLRLLRQQEYDSEYYSKMADIMGKEARGEKLGLSKIEEARWRFRKRFSNTWFKIANSIGSAADQLLKKYHNSLESLWKTEDIGKFFVGIPDAEAGPAVTQYWLHKANPKQVPMPGGLSDSDKKWADYMYGGMKSHQTEAHTSGMISDDTFQKIGEVHLPAQYLDTPSPDADATRTLFVPIRTRKVQTRKILGEPESQYVAIKAHKIPRLDSPTLSHRGADIPEVFQRLQAGQLITDPADVTMRGYVMDRLLLNNFKMIRDIADSESYAKSAADMLIKYGKDGKINIPAAEAAGYMRLDSLHPNIAATIRRMLGKKESAMLGKDGELPWITRAVYDQLFGKSGTFTQIQSAVDMLELGTTIHKTSKTGLSIPTHFQNLIGNWSMLSQAGFNPLTPENLRIQGEMARAFQKIAKVHRLAKESGENSVDILNSMKIDLGKITISGRTFDMNKEILSSQARELFEESAFNTVEGFAHLEDMVTRLRQEQRMTKAVAKTFLGGKKLLQMNDKEGYRWFDKMTEWYLEEDMVPKMAYFMKLRSQGLSIDSAVLEVGRRLPMYSTVGSSVRQGRRIAFPWLTFPTEALRITKNNLMDNPLRMAPWLRVPEIMQAVVAGTGGLDVKGVEEAKKALPMYAHTGSTIIGTGKQAATLGGGMTGGVVSAVGGAIAKSGKVGLAAAAIGAGAGALLANALTSDDNGDTLRGMVLNWLPHSSFMLTSTSPYIGDEVKPFRDLRGLQEQLPAEPFALLKPILDVTSGQTGFGTPVGGVTFGDKAGKALAGLLGFLSPPFIQKYGLRTSTPDVAMSKYIATTTGIGTEGIPGDFTNMSRLLVDAGIDLDPNTGKPGSPVHDAFFKNMGVGTSWPSDPAIRLRNETEMEGHLREVRGTMARNLSFHLINGEDTEATTILKKVMSTFTRQYGDNPRLAQVKYREWIETRLNMVGKHPQLRQWSQEELEKRLKDASKFATDERGKARDELIMALRNELKIRRSTGRG